MISTVIVFGEEPSARLVLPLSLREREGPNAKRWEGEGQTPEDFPLTLPLLRSGPLPLPLGEGQGCAPASLTRPNAINLR